jgi:hypothetical protein
MESIKLIWTEKMLIFRIIHFKLYTVGLLINPVNEGRGTWTSGEGDKRTEAPEESARSLAECITYDYND